MPGTTLERIEAFMAAHPGRVYNDWIECRAIVSKWLRKTKPKPAPQSLAQRQLAFREKVVAHYRLNPDQYEPEVYKGFLAYWTEPDSKTGKVMRFEKQTYFDIALKLAYHAKNFYKPQHTFSNGKSGNNERKLGTVTIEELSGQGSNPTAGTGSYPIDVGAYSTGEEVNQSSGGSFGNVYLDLE